MPRHSIRTVAATGMSTAISESTVEKLRPAVKFQNIEALIARPPVWRASLRGTLALREIFPCAV